MNKSKETTTKARGVTVNGEYFKSKELLLRNLQGILWAYKIGERVNAKDYGLLLDLLSRHPSAPEKIGCGIEAFEVRNNPNYANQRTFYLIRTDGSREDFSYVKCIMAQTSPRTMFRAVCRHLVSKQILGFKYEYFRNHAGAGRLVECAFTGEPVSSDDCHVDHTPPDTFERLVADFIEKYHINIEEVETVTANNGIGRTFTNPILIEQWMQYHKEHARLRVVSAHANTVLIPRSLRDGQGGQQKGNAS